MNNSVLVDEQWYLSQYPDVANAIGEGLFASAEHHYIVQGIREGRLPSKPVVDEAWYLRAYPDVTAAIREGHVKSAYDHFVRYGSREGRKPSGH